MARADWLVKLRISCAIYLQATRFASVKSEEIIQINLFLVSTYTTLQVNRWNLPSCKTTKVSDNFFYLFYFYLL